MCCADEGLGWSGWIGWLAYGFAATRRSCRSRTAAVPRSIWVVYQRPCFRKIPRADRRPELARHSPFDGCADRIWNYLLSDTTGTAAIVSLLPQHLRRADANGPERGSRRQIHLAATEGADHLPC